jgi:hypothetical protein
VPANPPYSPEAAHSDEASQVLAWQRPTKPAAVTRFRLSWIVLRTAPTLRLI